MQLIGVVTEEDYAPFLEQFHELDRTGDGKINKDDLAALAQSNQRKEAGEARGREERPRAVFSASLRQHAHDLLPHTFISCFGFLLMQVVMPLPQLLSYASLSSLLPSLLPSLFPPPLAMQEFGFLLTAGGLAHGLAIGAILGLPPSERKYRRVVMASASGALIFVAVIGLILFYLSNTQLYVEVMGKSHAVELSYLDERAVTVFYSDEYIDEHIDAWVSTVREPCNMIVVLVYAISLCNTVKLDVQTIVACRDARDELRREKEKRAQDAAKRRDSATRRADRAERSEKRLSGEAEASADGEATASATGEASVAVAVVSVEWGEATPSGVATSMPVDSEVPAPASSSGASPLPASPLPRSPSGRRRHTVQRRKTSSTPQFCTTSVA